MEIDYVIAWVDGQDPAHMAARRQFAPDSARTHFEAITSERYLDNGEIYYNIASVIKFAPFIKRIFIITDHQKPRLLDAFKHEGKCDASFIQIVSHDDIFEGLPAVRPSFNARAIEGAMWRIPGLSEHFIYSNDDFFVNAPLTISDLYEDERPFSMVIGCDLKTPTGSTSCADCSARYRDTNIRFRNSGWRNGKAPLPLA